MGRGKPSSQSWAPCARATGNSSAGTGGGLGAEYLRERGGKKQKREKVPAWVTASQGEIQLLLNSEVQVLLSNTGSEICCHRVAHILNEVVLKEILSKRALNFFKKFCL